METRVLREVFPTTKIKERAKKRISNKITRKNKNLQLFLHNGRLIYLVCVISMMLRMRAVAELTARATPKRPAAPISSWCSSTVMAFIQNSCKALSSRRSQSCRLFYQGNKPLFNADNFAGKTNRYKNNKYNNVGLTQSSQWITQRHKTQTSSFATIEDKGKQEIKISTKSIDDERDNALDDTISEPNFILDESHWKKHPSLEETFEIPTISIPNDKVHSVLSGTNTNGKKGHSSLLTKFLASNMDEFENFHPRVKLVRDLPPDFVVKNQQGEEESSQIVEDRKIILLDPKAQLHTSSTVCLDLDDNNVNAEHIELFHSLHKSFPSLPLDLLKELSALSAYPGPTITLTIPYTRQTITRILSKLLPQSAHPPPTGYEEIGHVIHLNLKSHHLPYKNLIGEVILDRLSPKIQTVVNKVGEVAGPYRTYDMEILAGRKENNTNNLWVKLSEDGIKLQFDLRKVYWCTRLAGERCRMVQEEFKEGEIIADAFCGVGALCVQAASKLGCSVYANDLNPDAVKYCRDNAKRNGVSASMFKVSCGDAFDFIQNLALNPSLPHHLVMNYPLDSASFLGALRWWPTNSNNIDSDIKLKETDEDIIVPTVHLYTFARADEDIDQQSSESPDESQHFQIKPRDATDVAIDIVAEGLLPEGGAVQKSRFRREFLNRLGCEVRAREVRNVAPGKVVICVSFKVTKLLVRIMQGDFVDI